MLKISIQPFMQKKPTTPNREEIINAIGQENIKTLNPIELELTEREITMNELEHCLKKTKNNIAPGSSGFTGAFYKAFWATLKYLVLSTINAIFISNELPESLRFGIINIIPKGTKDPRHLSNWRPLTLLNTLYKLISSILAERIKTVLNRILGPHQKAYIPGRFISEATKNTYDIFEQAIRTKNSGLAVLIDFEEAFDSVSF